MQSSANVGRSPLLDRTFLSYDVRVGGPLSSNGRRSFVERLRGFRVRRGYRDDVDWGTRPRIQDTSGWLPSKRDTPKPYLEQTLFSSGLLKKHVLARVFLLPSSIRLRMTHLAR